jgi:tetratricopeptide (TPR) repeat protein
VGKVESKLNQLQQRKAAGEYGAVVRLAQELLANPEGLSDRQSIDVARAGASAAIALEQVHLARQFADIERTWADGLADPVLVAVAAFHQGTAYLHVGDTHLALEHLRTFQQADMPGRPELDKYRGPFWFNLALGLISARDYSAAADALRAGREAYIQQGNHSRVIECNLEAAWCELSAGRPEPAGAYLEAAGTLLQEHPDDKHQATALAYWGLYHLNTGNVPRALEACQEVMLPGRKGITALHLTDAAWVSGECCLRLGHLHEARFFAAMALDKAMEARWMPAANRANDLRRRIVEAEGKTA